MPYTLPDVATPASLAPLLADKAVQERLRQHLPPGLDDNNVSESTLRSVVHSPEIKRSLASLDSALRTGALGPLVQSLGLKQEAALSVDQFLQGEREASPPLKSSNRAHGDFSCSHPRKSGQREGRSDGHELKRKNVWTTLNQYRSIGFVANAEVACACV